MILVTQSQDYFLPPTCNLIQGRLGLGVDVLCMDIVQGCAGYILGLIQAFMLLEQQNINKVVLFNADILSRKVSRYDRQISPMLGLSLIHISEPTRLGMISYAVFCLKKKKKKIRNVS